MKKDEFGFWLFNCFLIKLIFWSIYIFNKFQTSPDKHQNLWRRGTRSEDLTFNSWPLEICFTSFLFFKRTFEKNFIWRTKNFIPSNIQNSFSGLPIPFFSQQKPIIWSLFLIKKRKGSFRNRTWVAHKGRWES